MNESPQPQPPHLASALVEDNIDKHVYSTHSENHMDGFRSRTFTSIDTQNFKAILVSSSSSISSSSSSSSISKVVSQDAEEEEDCWDNICVRKQPGDAEEEINYKAEVDDVITDENSIFYGLNMADEKYNYFCKYVCDEYHDDFFNCSDWYNYFRWDKYDGELGWMRM